MLSLEYVPLCSHARVPFSLQVFHVTQGVAIFTIDEVPMTVKAGDVISIGPGHSHRVDIPLTRVEAVEVDGDIAHTTIDNHVSMFYFGVLV